MARPELGLKRQCMSCGAKFYDLARDPAVCPKCGATYQQAAVSRVAAPVLARGPAPAASDDEDETDEKGPELVSLDEVEAAEDEADPTPDDESGEDSDSGGDDDTFLEEEDAGDDDVSDLIDGDIESDEEG
ncbi:TIGR02300 family protein [Methylobacterium sp. NEAU 140]|uniref:TIGR02300 family protein n=1 Tax=Methylobacterium sp. NEAU 140 TaxID=3064945 RepID=UPI002735C3A5|nr:TIGR02300 family protein [Methylobacterium sp. NEAU 140]MDP4022548.1 TIGR02300 family protein [Methylobacterium sp. NEAU 140]